MRHLHWQDRGTYEEATLPDVDNPGGIGVSFTLAHMPTCHRRGPWCLRIEVARGPAHRRWGCFGAQDQPTRYYHSEERAREEAEAIAAVLLEDRWK